MKKTIKHPLKKMTYIVASLALAFSISAQAESPKQVKTEVSNKARAELCKEKLIKAAKLNLLVDIRTFDVVVGRTWHMIDYSTKVGLMENVECFILDGDKSKTITLRIKDNMTNKTLGKWFLRKLTVE